MPESRGIYLIIAFVFALCLSTASAGERVTINETVLDCVPEGCFVVRYVPEPQIKGDLVMVEELDNAETKVPADTKDLDKTKKEIQPVKEPAIADTKKADEGRVEKGAENKLNGDIERATIRNAKAARNVAILTGLLVLLNFGMLLAANRQAGIMSRTLTQLEAQTRGYVSIDLRGVILQGVHPETVPHFISTISATGHTPVENLDVYIKASIRDFESKQIIGATIEGRAQETIMQPGDRVGNFFVALNEFELSGQQSEAIANQTCDMIVEMSWSYGDAFGKTHPYGPVKYWGRPAIDQNGLFRAGFRREIGGFFGGVVDEKAESNWDE